MIHRTSLPVRALALILFLGAGAGCTGDSAAGVTGASPAPASHDLIEPLLGARGGRTLLECRTPRESRTVTSLLDALGGTLQIGNTRVVIPANALLGPTRLQMTIPASRYAEISVVAEGTEHFLFALPVLVSNDYGDCADSLPLLHPVSAWHIDERSGSLLENMGGVDLRLFHTITFFTGHLSGYAVAA